MPLKSSEVIKLLCQAGWEIVLGGKGSHTKLRKNKQITIVPHNKEIPLGTLRAIERQTGVKLRNER